MHFTVLLRDSPDREPIDTSQANRARIQDLLTAATRTWADRLLSSPGSIDQSVTEHYAEALPEEFKQVVTPAEAVADIAIVEALERDAVKLQLEPGEGGEIFLTWCAGARGAPIHRDQARRTYGENLSIHHPAGLRHREVSGSGGQQ